MTKFKKLTNRIKKDKYLIVKLIRTAAARGISAFGTFIFNFVLAKYLGVSDFGNFMLAYSLLVGLGFFVRFGMTAAIMRFAAIMFASEQFGQIKKLRKDVLWISIAGSLLLGCLLILARPYLSVTLFEGADVSTLLLILAFALPFYSYQTIQSSFFKAYKRPELAPFFEIGLTTFLTGSGVAFLTWYGLKANGEIVSLVFLISSVIVVLIGYLMLSSIIKKAENNRVYKLEKYTGFYETLPDFALSAITGYLLKFSPTIILGLYASAKDVGLYSLANSAAFVINFVLWIVSTVYAPYFASYHSEGKNKELRSLVLSSTMYMMFIATPIFLVIVCFPKFILGYFGNEFTEASDALVIMAFAQLFNVLTGPVYFLLNMTGLHRKLRNIVLITAVISISSSFALVPFYGYMGAAISSAIGLVVQNSVGYFLAAKYLGVSLFNKTTPNKI